MTPRDPSSLSATEQQRLKTNWEHVVWGCERPELLLTEAMAMHDRRTSDLPSSSDFRMNPPNRLSDGKAVDAGSSHDPHYDQKYRPEGSLFFELFNPWTAQDAPAPELQSLDTTNQFGVDLTLRTPTAGVVASPTLTTTVTTNGGDPVWRVVIADPTQYGTLQWRPPPPKPQLGDAKSLRSARP